MEFSHNLFETLVTKEENCWLLYVSFIYSNFVGLHQSFHISQSDLLETGIFSMLVSCGLILNKTRTFFQDGTHIGQTNRRLSALVYEATGKL